MLGCHQRERELEVVADREICTPVTMKVAYCSGRIGEKLNSDR